jgi:hypothetical protein
MATGVTLSSDNALLQFIEEDALHVLREGTLMTNLVTPFNGTGYATRKVGVWAQATAQTKAEGVDFANPTKASKTVKAQWTPAVAMAQYLLTDEAVQTDSENDIRSASSRELGFSIAEKIDTDLLGAFSSFTHSLGSAGSAASIALAGAAMAILRNAKARGQIFAVWHPFHWHDLWIELGQPGANQSFLGDTANRAMMDYFVMSWNGMMHFSTANISVDSSDDAISGIFTQDALAFDQREAFYVEPDRDASKKATELNGAVGYGYGTLRSESGLALTADATAPS